MRNDILKQAQDIRGDINTVIATLTDAQAVKVKALYLPWAENTDFVVGDTRRDGDKLFRCLQNHTSQADWRPAVTPALWVEVAAEGEYREIKDGMLSTEAFAKGEIGWWETKENLYESLIDGNVYTPVSYPDGWHKVGE